MLISDKEVAFKDLTIGAKFVFSINGVATTTIWCKTDGFHGQVIGNTITESQLYYSPSAKNEVASYRKVFQLL